MNGSDTPGETPLLETSYGSFKVFPNRVTWSGNAISLHGLRNVNLKSDIDFEVKSKGNSLLKLVILGTLVFLFCGGATYLFGDIGTPAKAAIFIAGIGFLVKEEWENITEKGYKSVTSRFELRLFFDNGRVELIGPIEYWTTEKVAFHQTLKEEFGKAANLLVGMVGRV